MVHSPVGRAVLLTLLGSMAGRPLLAQGTWRVSVDSSGGQGDRLSRTCSLTADGRFAVFESYSTNLVPGDTNGTWDVFVHDRRTGATTRVSVASTGLQADGQSTFPTATPDGRFVAFTSDATNLVPGDTNGLSDAFVHDRQTGTTVRVSVDSAGIQGNHWSGATAVSADGRFVGVASRASNLVPGDGNQAYDAFVYDRATGQIRRVSVDSTGTQGDADSYGPQLSADGRLAALRSFAPNLVPGDTNGHEDVFVHDLATGVTTRVSVDSGGGQAQGQSSFFQISADGRCVAFYSDSDNLVAADTNGWHDAFVHGPYLTLEANADTLATGALGAFATWTGLAGAKALFALVDLNGAPAFLPLQYGTFDAAGSWSVSGTVPPGLSGNVLAFQSYGFTPAGKVGVTNPVTITFL